LFGAELEFSGNYMDVDLANRLSQMCEGTYSHVVGQEDKQGVSLTLEGRRLMRKIAVTKASFQNLSGIDV
jgi:hypothetical protein